MINIRTDLQEYDPSKKTGPEGYARATKMVRYLRMCSKDIVNRQQAKINKSYLFGIQDMKLIKDMFKDPAKSGVNFAQYAIMEKIRNVLIAEQEDTGISFRLRSTDVTATNEKERDFELLQNRSWIEPTMTQVNKMMGLPPYSMVNNDKKLFNGNVTEFDKSGLDSNSSEDLNYFFAEHYRLLHEMVGEEPINYFIKYNELEDFIPIWYNDILSVKCCGSRTYVNDITGMIDYKYLAPENIKAIAGRRRDYKDASSLSYEQTMSISDMIKLIGNEFDFNRDMNQLLQAVNSIGHTNFTGITDGKTCIFGSMGGSTMACSDFLAFNVEVGYIEWKEFNASSHNIWRSSSTGRFGMKAVNYYEPEKKNPTYQRDCRYYETTYKSYYLATGSYECILYKYGPLNYQMIEGAEDEYSNFSIHINQEYGKSAIEIAIPYIDMYEKSMKKLEYMIVRAKPPGRMWSYESLLKMAKGMFPKLPAESAITTLMARFKGMEDEMYAQPEVKGQVVGGGGAMNFDLPHGLSQSVMQFQQLAKYFEDQIMEKLGISPLRSAYQPGEKDGLGLQQQATAYSEKATAYMPRMIQRQVKNIAIRTLSYVQDIVQFNDKESLPYKALLQGLGDNTMNELDHLKKISFHRYNIFVEGLGSMADKREIQAMAMQALQKNQITLEQWLLIKDISSPRKAATVLAYEKKRNERIAQQSQAAIAQQAAALEDKRHQNKMAEIQLEGEMGIKRENTRGYWYDKGQQTSAEGAMNKQQVKIDAEPELIKAKNDAKIDEAIVKITQNQMSPAPVG